jgi:hypothetical protein
MHHMKRDSNPEASTHLSELFPTQPSTSSKYAKQYMQCSLQDVTLYVYVYMHVACLQKRTAELCAGHQQVSSSRMSNNTLEYRVAICHSLDRS